MPSELLIALCIGLVILVAAIRAVVVAPRLGITFRIVAALVFAPWALFCVYGFAASMEPGDFHVVWRVAYAAVFFACVSAIGRFALAKPQQRNDDQN